MLPYPNDVPAEGSEFAANALVSLSIAVKFAFPKKLIGSRQGAVDRATMPEATIHKDRETLCRKDEVRISENTSAPTPPLDLVSAKNPNQTQFGGLVAPAFYARHDFGSLRNRKHVRHVRASAKGNRAGNGLANSDRVSANEFRRQRVTYQQCYRFLAERRIKETSTRKSL
jgi:hypothetical protein